MTQRGSLETKSGIAAPRDAFVHRVIDARATPQYPANIAAGGVPAYSGLANWQEDLTGKVLMKFSLLLFGLLKKLQGTAKKSSAFRERLRERNFTLQIKTRDNLRGRYYIFSDGEVFSKKGIHSKPDVALVWKSEDFAFKTMKAGDRDATMKAREDGDLVVDGDPMLAMWFSETMSQMRNPDAANQAPPVRKEKVAVIGVGNMGGGIARNIMRAGFEVTVYNRTEAKTKAFTDAGAKAAKSPKGAAEGADIVITSLMGDDSVMSVVEGESGLLAGLKPGAVHVGTSTISPDCATRLAEMHTSRGCQYVSGPVLGRPDVANAGELVTFVSGDKEAIEKSRPVLDAYTRMVRVIPGEHRQANVTKLCANYTAACVIELMGQVYTLADANGLNLDSIEDLFQTSWAHPGLKEYATQLRQRAFDTEDGFAMSGGLKDMQLMLDSSEAVGVSLDFGKIVKAKFVEGIESGMANKDWSATYEITRRRAGLT